MTSRKTPYNWESIRGWVKIVLVAILGASGLYLYDSSVSPVVDAATTILGNRGY